MECLIGEPVRHTLSNRDEDGLQMQPRAVLVRKVDSPLVYVHRPPLGVCACASLRKKLETSVASLYFSFINLKRECARTDVEQMMIRLSKQRENLFDTVHARNPPIC